MDPVFSLVIGMEILVRPMSKDFPAWRRGQLGKSRREEKLHSLHDAGLYYWKPGVLCYFIIVFLWRKLSVTFLGGSYGHFRRRRGGNWLENLAKHHARRLVYYCMLFYRHTKRSTDESRRDGDGERRIRYAQDQGGYGAMNIKILQDQSTIVARDEDVNPEPCRHEKVNEHVATE